MARLYSGNRYYRSKSQRSGGGDHGLTVRIAIFTLLICLACVLRFAESPALADLREKMAAVVRTDTDYRGAVEVIGRAVAGESEAGENAIMVFGRKLLGLEGEADDSALPVHQDLPVPGTEVLPEGEVTQPSDEDMDNTAGDQGGDRGLDPGASVMPQQAKAGDVSGFGFDEDAYAYEAVMPVFAVSHSLLGQALLWDEMDDNTPDEAFEIPSPDIVDDTVYTLPFEHAAPASGRVSSHFGYRIHPISGNTTFHHGADLAVATGTAVKAFAAGKVAETGYHSVYGHYIKLEHADGFLSMYAHLDSILVKKGKKVKLGDTIALSGNSGYSTGAHLHFEVRRNGKVINPFDYVSFE